VSANLHIALFAFVAGNDAPVIDELPQRTALRSGRW
jgi:hypothetical protein